METKQHSSAYKALLLAGARLKPLQQVHAQIITSGSHHSRALLTKLLTLVCSAGSIHYTRQLFLSVPKPDSFLFNYIITSSPKLGFSSDSVNFYHKMLLSNIPPSNYTFSSVIKACANLVDFRLGRIVHSHVLVCGYGLDLYVHAALVSFYAKCGDLDMARKVFDIVPERSIIAWNAMISGYEQMGFATKAIGLFDLMRESGVKPDSATFVSVLSACSQLGSIGLGCWVHKYIVKNGIDVNVILGTALINMYTRCGCVNKARRVFDGMSERNVVAWTAIISGYGVHGYGVEAIDLFRQMTIQGPSPNHVTFIGVLSACAHAGLVCEGRHVFSIMKKKYGVIPKMEHHVCMVDLLGRAGFLGEAIQYIEQAISGEPPPAVWTAMLGACKVHKNFDLGVEVAERLLAIEPDNPGHYVLLSNIYALAGRMDRVQMVRDMMIKRGLKKKLGYSIIEIDGETHMFSMGDKSHPETTEIYRAEAAAKFSIVYFTEFNFWLRRCALLFPDI
ncbi:Pentatricopeptide repeat [Dillenia turbinata]|uniref:Pentatricopeptide repeat n=1 Tax=Dillenia turbinata TaxID=194707 RepID=A0AAN8ZG30_9MAGN